MLKECIPIKIIIPMHKVHKDSPSRPPSLKDLEALEPDFYNSLLWIRDNDPEPLDLTFTVEEVRWYTRIMSCNINVTVPRSKIRVVL